MRPGPRSGTGWPVPSSMTWNMPGVGSNVSGARTETGVTTRMTALSTRRTDRRLQGIGAIWASAIVQRHFDRLIRNPVAQIMDILRYAGKRPNHRADLFLIWRLRPIHGILDASSGSFVVCIEHDVEGGR